MSIWRMVNLVSQAKQMRAGVCNEKRETKHQIASAMRLVSRLNKKVSRKINKLV